MKLTILMPCLNEAETLSRCIEKARAGLDDAGVSGEILIADNGSTDGSQRIAEKLGARVVPIVEVGYGSALIGGIRAARGEWIVMGDADDSYDFRQAYRFVNKLQQGDDLVMGCRLPAGGGTIVRGAMPWRNRWIGNPSLSFIGRLLFNAPVHDFHCGLRGFTKDAFEKMDLKTTGMEFASEMVIKATLKGLRISEVPITLYKDGRSRSPHLKPWRDGWRHLRFMLLFSPRWLFLVPGTVLMVVGLTLATVLAFMPGQLFGAVLDVGSLLVASMTAMIGFQLVTFSFFTKVFAIAEGLLPNDEKFARLFKFFTLEKGIVAGGLVTLVGLGLLAQAVWVWRQAGFGDVGYSENLRRLIPATIMLVLGVQTIFASFFMSVLGLKTTTRQPPASHNDAVQSS